MALLAGAQAAITGSPSLLSAPAAKPSAGLLMSLASDSRDGGDNDRAGQRGEGAGGGLTQRISEVCFCVHVPSALCDFAARRLGSIPDSWSA